MEQSEPLAPLSAHEFRRAVEIISSKWPRNTRLRFMDLDLHEPEKQMVVEFLSGKLLGHLIPRRAKFVVIDDKHDTYSGVANLTTETIESSVIVEIGQPAFQLDEFDAVENAVKNDPEVVRLLKERGVTDINQIMVDAGSIGAFDFEWEWDENDKEKKKKRRLSQALIFTRINGDNGYAHPIDGLIPIVDVNTMKVIHIEQHDRDPPPRSDGHYERKFLKNRFQNNNADVRTNGLPLQPLVIEQPNGPSFIVRNQHHVLWDRWSFRVGFNAKEGLILHAVTYADRPILYRASLVEMTVPYGDPRPQHFRKNAFDVGEYGVGRCANSLKLGCDCLGHIHYFDAHMIDSKGNVITIANAICMHEEDYGVLWKHLDWRTGEMEVRRNRRLVVSFFTTVANYEYGFYYYLYLDGNIEFEVKLTGIINVGHCAKKPNGQYDVPKYGAIVANEGLYGLIHQHFFCFRLDMGVDDFLGPNRIYEVNTQYEDDETLNPQRNAYYVREKLLASESVAKGNLNPATSRVWKIENPSKRNRITDAPTAYILEPGSNTVPLADPRSVVMRRADYLRNQVNVTEYHPNEYYPSGDFPNQHPGVGYPGSGLPEFTKRDASLVDKNVVIWYTIGKTHQPRPEDWPVMPVAHISFHLKPWGFFEKNPSIDLPPERADKPHEKTCCQPKL